MKKVKLSEFPSFQNFDQSFEMDVQEKKIAVIEAILSYIQPIVENGNARRLAKLYGMLEKLQLRFIDTIEIESFRNKRKQLARNVNALLEYFERKKLESDVLDIDMRSEGSGSQVIDPVLGMTLFSCHSSLCLLNHQGRVLSLATHTQKTPLSLSAAFRHATSFLV